MMEIPAGKWCGKRCPFLHYLGEEEGEDCWFRMMLVPNPDYRPWTIQKPSAKRTKECLSAYPNGATVTITPKEGE